MIILLGGDNIKNWLVIYSLVFLILKFSISSLHFLFGISFEKIIYKQHEYDFVF